MFCLLLLRLCDTCICSVQVLLKSTIKCVWPVRTTIIIVICPIYQEQHGLSCFTVLLWTEIFYIYILCHQSQTTSNATNSIYLITANSLSVALTNDIYIYILSDVLCSCICSCNLYLVIGSSKNKEHVCLHEKKEEKRKIV